MLIPKTSGLRYWLLLAALAASSGGLGLLAARTVYTARGYTPGSPLYHFAIDTAGAIVHLALAAGAVWLWKRCFGKHRHT